MQQILMLQQALFGLQQMHYFAMVSIQLTSRMAGSECQLGSAR